MLTIITTTRDNSDELSPTLASLLAQSSRDFEWLIYDGSQDTPADVYGAFTQQAANHGIRARFAHAQDSSIYEAMQNSLKHASSEWCLFLNCGDMLCHPNVVLEVTSYFRPDADIVYGGNIYIDTDSSVHYHPGKPPEEIQNELKEGRTPYYHHMVCQQSIFYRRSLLERIRLFPASLRLAADHNHFLRLIQAKVPMLFFDKPISVYFGGGASYRYVMNTYAEWMLNHLSFMGEDSDISPACDHYLELMRSQLEEIQNA